MASYTEDDMAAANMFAESNTKIRMLRKMYEKSPHLVSWVKYTIRPATANDYYIPSTLVDAAKVVTVEMTEELCKLLSCTPVREKDPCPVNGVASYYYVGDDAYDVQCQPSCFHTATKITYNDDGSRAADVPQLNWHAGKCRIVNSSMVSYLEKTFYRSDTKYEIRVNDMPTGFSRIKVDDNPYGSGISYRTNSAYCGYYDRHLEADGSCEMSKLEFLLDAVIGQTLINSVKSGVRMLINNNIPFALPSNLPKLPDKLDPIHTLDGWRKNINTSFVLPDLIDTKPKAATAETFTASMKRKKRSLDSSNTDEEYDHEILHPDKETNDMIHFRRRAELLGDGSDLSNFMRVSMGMDVVKTLDKVVGLNDNGDIVGPMEKPKISKKSNNNDKANAANDDDDDDNNNNPDEIPKDWTEKMKDMFVSLLKMLTEKDFYIQAGIDYITGKALDGLKALCKKVIEKLSRFLAKGLFDVTGSIGIKVLTSSIKSVTLRIVTTLVLRIGAKVAIAIAKLLAAVASVVGWILIGTMLLDLMFSFWDPFGYNNLFPPEMPKIVMENGELALRQAMASATADYEFDNLAAIILSEDELLEIQLESLIDRITYLDALVVNSEGSRIDKGNEIDVNAGNQNAMDAAQTQGMAQKVHWNTQEYENYNRKFMARVDTNKYCNYAAAAMILLSGIFAAARIPLLCIVFIIIALIIMALARFELQDDLVVDFLEKYTNKDSPFSDGGFSPDY